MTDEEIKQIAEKTKKEKYCFKFRNGELECGDCPITYEGYPCSEDYVLPFIDGFKVALGLLPRFKPKNIGCIDEWIEKFKNNPQLQQSYIEELEKTIKKISIANE